MGEIRRHPEKSIDEDSPGKSLRAAFPKTMAYLPWALMLGVIWDSRAGLLYLNC